MTVADIIARNLRRPLDRGARYGGEEFAAILPQTPAEGALMIGEAIRREVRAAAVPHSHSETGIVTISIGIATSSGHSPGDSPQDLIRRADTALYAAKAAGRDRVIAGEPLPDRVSAPRTAMR